MPAFAGLTRARLVCESHALADAASAATPPRLLTIRLHTATTDLHWTVPLRALGEATRLLIGLAPLLSGRSAAPPSADGPPAHPDLVALLGAIAGERGDLLQLPPGLPLATVETPDLYLEIGQL